MKNLSADFLFAPGIMEFRNLDLETNRSRLRDYFAMRFESFNHDMNRFLHNVNLEAHFSESDLSSDDLAYFAPSLSSWKKKFHFTGRAKGTVDNFSTDKFQVSSGNTFFSGEIGMRGLPDINSTFIDLRSDGLKTQYADLAILIPSLRNIKQPSLHKLGNIYYKGNFTGFLNDFVAFGTIKTNLGTLTADLGVKAFAGANELDLNDVDLVYCSDSQLVASAASGTVTAAGPGTATITICAGSIKKTVTVNVTL